MAGESTISMSEGTPGKRAHTWQRVVSATNVEDEFTLPGEYPFATYIIEAISVSTGTANDHLLQIMAGAGLHVRIRKIEISQANLVTAAALASFDVLRLTTAGTGGTGVTAAKYDTADAAAGAAGMTQPTIKGTESTVLYRDRFALRQTNPVSPGVSESASWIQSPGAKGIIIPAGTANGIAVKNIVAAAGASVDITVEFVEMAYL